MGLSKSKERDFAKLLYTQERLSIKEVAERVDVSEKTVSKWRTQEGWDNIRKSLLITKNQQITHLYNQLEWLNDDIYNREVRIATVKEADIISKLTAAIKKLEVDASVGEIFEVGRLFIDFVREIDLTKAKDITTLFDLFIQSRMK